MLSFDKIYNMDCIEGLRQIDNNSIDLCVTSPPYNIGVKYDVCDDFIAIPDYYYWCREWMTEVYRVLKPDGRFCLNHYLSCGTSERRFAPLMDLNCICNDIGFKHHGIALWDDRTLTKWQAWGSWLSASAPYINSPHECILIMYKDHWKKDKAGISDMDPKEFMQTSTGIWKIQPEMNGLTVANFPVGLPMRCIRFLSYVGDVVLDPFSGSATTAYAAKISGRRFIGFELSEAYWKIGNRRLEQTGLYHWQPAE